MENEINKRTKVISDNRVWSGVALIVAGVVYLAYKMGAPIPSWVFTWKMLLIAVGLLLGIKSQFRNPGAFIMIFVGAVFLISDDLIKVDLHDYILPIILIGVGTIYVLKPKHTFKSEDHPGFGRRFSKRDIRPDWEESIKSNIENTTNASPHDSEYLEVNAVFGGVKKLVLSKNFRGGEINTFMGGAEINLLQADLQSPAIMEINNVFGGTKLILPSNWDVKSELTTVFGGVEDKRSINAALPDKNKTLVISGTCVFGGLDIRNF